MTGWYRRFIIAGLVLVLAGFIFGLGFSFSVDHQSRLVAHDAYQPVFDAIAREDGDAEWQGLEDRISARSVAQRRATDVHGHSINMGILLIMLGLLLTFLNRPPGTRDWALSAMIVSAVVYPVGLFLQFLTLTSVGEIVSALGAAGAILALGAFYFRVSRAVDAIE